MAEADCVMASPAHATPSIGRPTPPASGKRVTMSSQASTIGSRPSTAFADLADISGSPVTDYLKPIINNANRRWKQNQEGRMMGEIIRIKLEKKETNRALKEKAQQVARKIPMEILAKDWLVMKRSTIETRAYLVDKLLPLVVLGVEKLLMEVDARGLALTEEPDPNFNPLNFLAQYLMRNNPKYSNFTEASSYMRSLRQVAEQLKGEILNYDDNRLARLKAEAKRKREEYEAAEKQRLLERERRARLLDTQFLEWGVGRTGKIEIALLVTSLRSFAEITERYPDELKSAAKFKVPLLHPDEVYDLLTAAQFREYILNHTESLSSDIFDQLVEHLTKCAMAYQGAGDEDVRRRMLVELFNEIDRGNIGLLDRHRVLSLLEQFYDSAAPKILETLRNPRKWPVVQLDEEVSSDEEGDDDEKEEDDEKADQSKENEETQTKERKSSAGSAKSAGEDAEAEEKVVEVDEQEVVEQDETEQTEAEQAEVGEVEEANEQAEAEAAQEETTPDAAEPEAAATEAEAQPTETVAEEATADDATEEEKKVEEGTEGVSEQVEEGAEEKAAEEVNGEKSEETEETEEPRTREETLETVEEEQAEASSEADDVTEKEAQSAEDKDVDEAPPAVEEKDEEGSSSGKSAGVVSFAHGTIYRETMDGEERRARSRITQMSMLSRSQSAATAFDEDSLNESQFVQMTETFLGDEPDPVAFQRLVAFIRTGYVETEEERRQRMLKAMLEQRKAKRKELADNLFDKWDNDGSGYLEFAEVDPVVMQYKGGMEEEALKKAKKKVRAQQRRPDNRMSKKEFRFFLTSLADLIPGDDSYEYLVQFLLETVVRTYQERVRGEARKKWLAAIRISAITSAASMEPVFRAVFQALFKDAETHGGGKRINANISMLERNTLYPHRGPLMLRYVASTPSDAEFMIGQTLYQDMKQVSFTAVDHGKPVHVPKVQSHGSVHFFNPKNNSERDGSFIVVPLKDRADKVFGLLGLDTMGDAEKKSIFITHEIQFFQGVAKAFSIAYHYVDIRHKTMLIAESAVAWLHRRCFNCTEISFYLVEPNKTKKSKSNDFVLRKMLVTDDKGMPKPFADPPRMERKDNLFRDYLFKCVDTSESVSADAYGERHLAFPVRDKDGLAVCVLDISIGNLKKLSPPENKEMVRMLKLLQMVYLEIVKQAEEGSALDSSDVSIMFDKLMLEDLKENVRRLDARAYAELKSYYDPPKIIHQIIEAVLSIFYPDKALEGALKHWGACKQLVGVHLGGMITDFDPTTAESIVPPTDILAILEDVPHGEVARYGSKPAQHLYNWVFVCLSLLEHTRKMKAMRAPASSTGTPRSEKGSQKDETEQTEQTAVQPEEGDQQTEEPESPETEAPKPEEEETADDTAAIAEAVDQIQQVAQDA